MYLYFNKQGVLTTVIPHGEPVRQGSTLNLYVCFDEDYFSSKEELNKFVISSNLILPSSSNRSTDFIFQNYPSHPVLFEKLIDSEITYDLIPGKYYWIFHQELAPELSTVNSGKLTINVKIEKPIIDESLENSPVIETVKYLGKADVYIEKTYGNSAIVSNISENHYNNLVNQFKELLATVQDGYLRIPKPYDVYYDDIEKCLRIGTTDTDQYAKIYLKDDGEIELRSRKNGEEAHYLVINNNGLSFDGDVITTNSFVKQYSAPLIVIQKDFLTTVDYYDLITNNPFYTENTTPVIILQFSNGTYCIANHIQNLAVKLVISFEKIITEDSDKVNQTQYKIVLYKDNVSENKFVQEVYESPTLENYESTVADIKENTAPYTLIRQSQLQSIDYHARLINNGVHQYNEPHTVYFETSDGQNILMSFVEKSSEKISLVGSYAYSGENKNVSVKLYKLFIFPSKGLNNVLIEESTLSSVDTLNNEVNIINKETNTIKSTFNQSFKSVELNKNTKTGEYTITFIDFSGNETAINIDTPDEKIIDTTKPPYLQGNNLVLTFVDGSVVKVDMSKLVEYNSFSDTSTISIVEDTNHNVTATLINGSVTRVKLAQDVTGELDDIHETITKIQDKMGNVTTVDGSMVVGNTLVCGNACSFDEETGTLIVGSNFSVHGTTLVIK